MPSVSESTLHSDFQQLMEEADGFDAIHDVIVQVRMQQWVVSFIEITRKGRQITRGAKSVFEKVLVSKTAALSQCEFKRSFGEKECSARCFIH